MKKAIIITIIVLISLSTFIIYLKKSPNKISGNSIPENANSENPNLSPPQNSQENNGGGSENGENSDGSSGGESSGGGSGGGSSTNSETTKCYEKQVSYSLGNFNTNETCNQFQNSECINKTVICTAEITNFDSQFSPDFTMTFEFLNTDRVLLKRKTQTQNVPTNSQITFTTTENFQIPESSSPITCSFYASQVKKEIPCS